MNTAFLADLYKVLVAGSKENIFLKKELGVRTACELSRFHQAKSGKSYEEFWAGKISKIMGIDSQFEQEIITFISGQECERKEIYNKIKDFINGIDCTERTYQRWYTMQELLGSVGLFEAGLMCRNKCREAAYKTKGTPLIKLIFSIEDDNYEQALKYLKEFKRSPLSVVLYKNRELIEAYLSIVYKKELKLPRYMKKKVIKEFIKGKSVIIAGPGCDRTMALPFDATNKLIARINEFDGKTSVPPTDMSYYNGERTRNRYIKGDHNNSADMAVIISKGEAKRTNLSGILEKYYFYYEIDQLFYFEHANMVPKIIMDLIFNSAERIEVCGTNLFCARKIHADNYGGITSEKLKFIWSLGQHNLLCQFVFLSNLYKHGMFVADEELERVLKMDILDYARIMEEYHSLIV